MLPKSGFLFCIILSVFNISCTINGNFKGLYSYYNKTAKDRPQLFTKPADSISICDLKNTDLHQVYIINGKMLKDCLNKTGKTVVYIWAPNCKSEFCYSLNFLQEKCKAKKAELFVVAEYYDVTQMDFLYDIEHPIFGIDTKHYHSELTSTYLRLFYDDLVTNAMSNKGGRILYFENGILKGSFLSIDDI